MGHYFYLIHHYRRKDAMKLFSQYRRSQAGMKIMYNRINRLYGCITRALGPKLGAVVTAVAHRYPDLRNASVLEYACGTGHLSLPLASRCGSLTARDLSVGMLEIAKERAGLSRIPITFREGDLLAVDEAEASFDYVFVSFALHLFPVETEVAILRHLCRVGRRAVVIIDHERRWRPMVALAEWLEGSYYDQFIATDFGDLWKQIGAVSFEEEEIEECRVMAFKVNSTKGFT